MSGSTDITRKVSLSVQSWWSFRKRHWWKFIPLCLSTFERARLALCCLPGQSTKVSGSLPVTSRIPTTISFARCTPCLEQCYQLEALLAFKQSSISNLSSHDLHSTEYPQINCALSFLQAAIASPVKNHSPPRNREQPLRCVSSDLADLTPTHL